MEQFPHETYCGNHRAFVIALNVVFMNKASPLAVLCGLTIGVGMYWLLVPDWHVALGIATVYAGAGYFYFEFDISLFAASIQFDDRVDKLGYAVGLFGLCVSPMAFADHYGQSDPIALAFVIWVMGVIAFLFFVSRAHHQERHSI